MDDASLTAEEEETIRRCLSGQKEAYGLLVERYKTMIHNLAYRMVGNGAEAEDIAQETFIKGYVALRSFRGDCRFSTWLCRITLNKCKDLLRKRRHGDAVVLPESQGNWANPGQVLEGRERGAAVQRALSRLPAKYREAVILRHLEDLDYPEVAEILGVPVGTVKVRAFRGREMLRTLLAHEGVWDGTRV
ncbi:MAG: RNA polymerase sigma factor [Candidatus Methylomirabilales bacterium]